MKDTTKTTFLTNTLGDKRLSSVDSQNQRLNNIANLKNAQYTFDMNESEIQKERYM